MTDTADRCAGALLGLAIGDAAGWPSTRHRSQLLPSWTRRLRRELDVFAETEQVTTLPVPFALNQPTDALRLGPSDDAEWAVWTGTRMLATPAPVRRADVHEWWRTAALGDVMPRGRISVTTAVESLRRGVEPPQSGHDNPHHFDDAAAVRAVAIAVGSTGPDEAARVAGWDAEVTNSGDGVVAARAVAEAVARLIEGEAWTSAWSSASRRLPDGLAATTVERARHVVAQASSPAEAVPALAELVDHVYSYGVAAAQTLAVAVALAEVTDRSSAAPIDAVTAAACLPTLADSAPALTGALTGAGHGARALPSSWAGRCRSLAGCCAPELAGIDVIDIATRLAAARTRKDDP